MRRWDRRRREWLEVSLAGCSDHVGGSGLGGSRLRAAKRRRQARRERVGWQRVRRRLVRLAELGGAWLCSATCMTGRTGCCSTSTNLPKFRKTWPKFTPKCRFTPPSSRRAPHALKTALGTPPSSSMKPPSLSELGGSLHTHTKLSAENDTFC